MEQDVESTLTGYRHVCSTCLSSDRNLISLNAIEQMNQVFRLLMYDFAGDTFGDPLSDIDHLVCWECSAVMKRLVRFKQQVHSAQQHLRVLALGRGQDVSMSHTFLTQSLSPLEAVIKTDYDKIYFEYNAGEPVWTQFTHIVQDETGQLMAEHLGHDDEDVQNEDVKNEDFDVAQVVRENISLDGMDGQILEVPVLESMEEAVPVSSMSHIVLGGGGGGGAVSGGGPTLEVSISSLSNNKLETVITRVKAERSAGGPDSDKKCGYVSETMSEAEMLAYREEEKRKVQYASSAYKCELCIVGFYTQQQVEDHFIAAHRAKEGFKPCKVCYVYVDKSRISTHTASHYTRYICKYCGHTEHAQKACAQHVRTHVQGAAATRAMRDQPKRRKRKDAGSDAAPPPRPGDLRKLLSKTTIEGYKCLECDMFFGNSRARKNHVARFHREGLQCDHCKKRFVNRTTLATHLKLHEGPPPRAECPICHKQVRVIQLKYHVQRHQNKSRYECADCSKVFSHLATYQAHLKYSRAHASDEVFKFPCPMCNKGYPTKEQMQDHFNYQHLGKTSHKCPICDKPIASRANVEKHMMRVHGEKRDKPRNHQCQQCGKAFTALMGYADPFFGDQKIFEAADTLYTDLSTKSVKSAYTRKMKKNKKKVKYSIENYKSFVIRKTSNGRRVIKITVTDLNAIQKDMNNESEDENDKSEVCVQYVVTEAVDDVMDMTENLINKISKKLANEIA